MSEQPFLQAEGFRKAFSTDRGMITALNSVSFSVEKGQTTAIVGESGCGKTTLALCMLGLVAADDGTITLDGDSKSLTSDAIASWLGRDIGIVFQNPYSALNPKMKVHQIVAEPLKAIEGLRGKALRERVNLALSDVGLGREHLRRYPHEFSGGQRQRIAIARALAARPRLLILDEPTAALDVSIQAQVLTLLKDLQSSHGTSYVFITHDLGTVEYFADRIVVMYLGNVVESGPVETVFAAPRHPYTRALLDSVPTVNFDTWGQLKTLSGEIPSALNRPDGCPFAPRCVHADTNCKQSEPQLVNSTPDHAVACFHPLIKTQMS